MPVCKRSSQAVLLLVLMSSLSPFVVANSADKDKKMHFGASTLLSTSMYFMHSSQDPHQEGDGKRESKGFAFTTCAGIGLAKETYDQYHSSGFDMSDMTMNIAGCALGTVAAARLNKFIITPTVDEDRVDEEVYGIRITKFF